MSGAQSAKEFVISQYPDAKSFYSEETLWCIDSSKPLNWSDRTEELAWRSAAYHIRYGIDPTLTPVPLSAYA
jgi:hypothetical protein